MYRVHLSHAAMTHAKYGRNIQQITRFFYLSEKREDDGTEKIGLVTPTAGGQVIVSILGQYALTL